MFETTGFQICRVVTNHLPDGDRLIIALEPLENDRPLLFEAARTAHITCRDFDLTQGFLKATLGRVDHRPGGRVVRCDCPRL